MSYVARTTGLFPGPWVRALEESPLHRDDEDGGEKGSGRASQLDSSWCSALAV
jgi:hypothetical protein